MILDPQKPFTLRPQDDMYVVEILKPQKTTKAGLELPEDKDLMNFVRHIGRVLEVGPGARNPRDPAGARLSMKAKVGDMVMFARAQATPIEGEGGMQLAFVQDRDILMVPDGLSPEDLRQAGGGVISVPTPGQVAAVSAGPKLVGV